MSGECGGQQSRRWRVVSYNVHACVGRDGVFAPARILDVLRPLDADVIALQEVEDRRYRGSNVSNFLATELGMHAYRGPTLARGEADYGNLLLTKPVADNVRAHDLSVARREPRGAIETLHTIGKTRLSFTVTHLGLSGAERRRQLRQLLTHLDDLDADVRILAGDINEWRPISALHRELARRFGPPPRLRTFPSNRPLLALDRIYVAPQELVRRLDTVRSGAARSASDHLPVVCEVQLPA
jgi:endonuclease/exonuclease/phosphatase family metal-dependent hydrolase